MNKLFKTGIIFLLVINCTVLLAEESAGEATKKETAKQAKKDVIQETVLGMNVSGNKEAPNLLYIIPWKDTSREAKPVEIYRLMDEVYSTLDPDVFIKEVTYYEKVNGLKTQSKPNDLSQAKENDK